MGELICQEAAARYTPLECGVPSGHVVAVGFAFDAGMRPKNEATPRAYSRQINRPIASP